VWGSFSTRQGWEEGVQLAQEKLPNEWLCSANPSGARHCKKTSPSNKPLADLKPLKPWRRLKPGFTIINTASEQPANEKKLARLFPGIPVYYTPIALAGKRGLC
jgi:hypothetical protein